MARATVSDSDTPERYLDRSTTDSGNSRRTESASRRAFVRAAGAAALAASGPALGRPAVAAGQYDQTLDVVDDLGADPTGEKRVTDVIDEGLQDDTKLSFPEGSHWLEGDGLERWGEGRSASFDPDDE